MVATGRQITGSRAMRVGRLVATLPAEHSQVLLNYRAEHALFK